MGIQTDRNGENEKWMTGVLFISLALQILTQRKQNAFFLNRMSKNMGFVKINKNIYRYLSQHELQRTALFETKQHFRFQQFDR